MENIIGVKMGELMREKGITASALSEKLEEFGVKLSVRELESIENRTRRVSDIELLAISKALGESVDLLTSCVKA